ncbi:MAG: hypothetical protein WHU10_08560 [Fimbriimonadales bacterium]
MGLYDYPNHNRPGETWDCPTWSLHVTAEGDVRIDYIVNFRVNPDTGEELSDYDYGVPLGELWDFMVYNDYVWNGNFLKEYLDQYGLTKIKCADGIWRCLWDYCEVQYLDGRWRLVQTRWDSIEDLYELYLLEGLIQEPAREEDEEDLDSDQEPAPEPTIQELAAAHGIVPQPNWSQAFLDYLVDESRDRCEDVFSDNYDLYEKVAKECCFFMDLPTPDDKYTVVSRRFIMKEEVVDFIMQESEGFDYDYGYRGLEEGLCGAILRHPDPDLREAIEEQLKNVNREEFLERFPSFEHLLPPV